MTNLSSPLQEVQKNSLAELFQRDPLLLNKDDVETICKALREQRKNWMIDDQKAKNKPKAKDLPDLNMNDLLDGIL